MPLVRPTGHLGPVGLILPTAPQGEFPAYMGAAAGATRGITSGTTTVPTAPHLAALCAGAEAAGAGALWAVDHLFWPRPMLECLTTLTVAATATSRATIGSCVLQLPLRSAAAVAKQATALQILSGGRFVLGVGVGSHPAEYEAAGVDYRRRGRLVDLGLAELRRAWAGPAADPGDGGDGRDGGQGSGWDGAGTRYAQAPTSPPVPVWVGGSSEAALERAGRSADGWVPLFVDPPTYAAALSRLRWIADTHGRQPDDLTPAVVALVSMAGTGIGTGPGSASDVAEQGCAWLSSLYGLPPKAFARHLISGSAGQCAAGVQAYLDAGARHVAVMVCGEGALDQFGALVEAMGTRAAGTSRTGAAAEAAAAAALELETPADLGADAVPEGALP